MSQIYLAKRGKVFGPYTSAEYDTLCTSSEIEDYRWIWKESDPKWTALDPAPTVAPQKAHTQTAAGNNLVKGDFQVVCLTTEQTVAANLTGWTETACELTVNVDRLMLSEGQSVILHFWNPSNEQAMNISAKITQRLRQGEGWSLRLRWSAVPEMLKG